MISYGLWSNLLYSILYDKEHSLLSLECMVLTECLSMALQSWYYLCRRWKERRYLRERKSKLDKLTPNKRMSLEDNSELPITSGSTISDNVSVATDDVNLSFSESIENELCNAPDLLQGNLHRMYIDRKGKNERSSNQRVQNHVVAALRYNRNSRSSPTISTTTERQPLIRPATFIYNNNNPTTSSSISVHRTALFQSNVGTEEDSRLANKIIEEEDFVITQHEDRPTTTNESSKLEDDGNVAAPEENSYLSWKILVCIFFLASVVLNIAFLSLYKNDVNV